MTGAQKAPAYRLLKYEGKRKGLSSAGAVPLLTKLAMWAPVTAARVIPSVEWPVAR